jgi:hypothetical protein
MPDGRLDRAWGRALLGWLATDPDRAALERLAWALSARVADDPADVIAPGARQAVWYDLWARFGVHRDARPGAALWPPAPTEPLPVDCASAARRGFIRVLLSRVARGAASPLARRPAGRHGFHK